jgi:hypothetical protein
MIYDFYANSCLKFVWNSYELREHFRMDVHSASASLPHRKTPGQWRKQNLTVFFEHAADETEP